MGKKKKKKKSTLKSSKLSMEDETKLLQVSTDVGQVCVWSLARLEDTWAVPIAPHN